MKMSIFALLIGILLLVSACTQNKVANDDVMMDSKLAAESPEIETAEGKIMNDNDATDPVMTEQTTDTMMEGFSGKVLAGTTTPYIEFNQADYEKAIAEHKVIILNFYASWCPSCQAEQPDALKAFDMMNNPDVVGFRVRFKDGESKYELSLAKQFGVPYQHTKVIVKDGKQLFKSPESWDTQRYIDEANKYV